MISTHELYSYIFIPVLIQIILLINMLVDNLGASTKLINLSCIQ